MTQGNDRKAKAYRAHGGGYWLETPFDAAYVAELKALLPRHARKWSPDLGCWWIHPDFYHGALAIAARYFSINYGPAEAKPPAPPATADPEPWATLWLLPGAPPPVVKAAYRALARVKHPDAGGDEQEMKQINAAYELLLDGAT